MSRPRLTFAEAFLTAGAGWLFAALGLAAGPAREAVVAVGFVTLFVGLVLAAVRILSILADCLVDTVRPDRDLTDLPED